jgi:hypothetical protein
LKAETGIEVESGVDVFDEEIWSKRFHGDKICSNILIYLVCLVICLVFYFAVRWRTLNRLCYLSCLTR